MRRGFRTTGRKYNNHKVTVDGITFDSKKEAKRYQELRLLEKAGAIRNLERQKKFILIPAQYEDTGEIYSKGVHKGEPKKRLVERECAYIADFAYWDTKAKDYVVEDTKGFRTPDYIIKRKLMLYVHGIKIEEI